MHKLGIAQEIIDLTTEYVRGARVKRVWRRPLRYSERIWVFVAYIRSVSRVFISFQSYGISTNYMHNNQYLQKTSIN